MGQDPREIRRDVEAARARLGATVEALAHRANAPRRAREHAGARIRRLKERARSVAGRRAGADSPPEGL